MRSFITVILLALVLFAKAQIIDSLTGLSVYNVPEQLPEFIGGESELQNFLRQNIKYPSYEKDHDIQGRVMVKFVIDTNGKVLSPRILKGVSPGLNNESLRVVSTLPDFKPGRINGEKVNSYFNIPIAYKINDGQEVKKLEKDVYDAKILNDPNYADAYSAYSKADYKTAIKYYNKVIKEYPNNFEGYLCVALGWQKLGDKSKACKMFYEAIKRGSKDAVKEMQNNCN